MKKIVFLAVVWVCLCIVSAQAPVFGEAASDALESTGSDPVISGGGNENWNSSFMSQESYGGIILLYGIRTG